MPSDLVHLYMRIDHLPQIWCPGCGNGVIMRDVAVAIDELIHDEENPINREDIVIVSGIGCSSRAAGYLDFNSIHTTHGRAIAFASGIKMANPKLHVIVLTGDGDCSAIGGNHLIHAARRNLGLTVICFNNDIYGMTGGQYSPTTPNGDKATTAPYGNVDRPFDIANLASGAGASFSARGDVYHARETIDIIKRSGMDRGYVYHIFGGQKANPSRDKVLVLALAMELSPKETQHFLHYAGAGALYVRDHFDSVIWYALEHKLGVTETNLVLDELGLRTLSL